MVSLVHWTGPHPHAEVLERVNAAVGNNRIGGNGVSGNGKAVNGIKGNGRIDEAMNGAIGDGINGRF